VWTTDGYRVTLGEILRVSFQRTIKRSSAETLSSVPRSYGASPIEVIPEDRRHYGHIAAHMVVPVRDDAAFWLGISPVHEWVPGALRVRIEAPEDLDAVSGLPWSDQLRSDPQNYIVSPPQRSLLGLRVPSGKVRQFVRAGRSATSMECRQVVLTALEALQWERTETVSQPQTVLHGPVALDGNSEQPSGEQTYTSHLQETVLLDPYGRDFWNVRRAVSVRIALVNDDEFTKLTGKFPPGPLNESETFGGWHLP
jgi:hypothetical protein